MGLTKIFKKMLFPHTYSQKAYIDYLRKHKVIVGNNVSIYSPNHTHIDIMRPYVIKIGDNCKITSGVTILAHDYSVSVPRKVYGDFIGGGQPVSIGNNCFLGTNATILMGTTIGDNCIIGAGSVVKGTYPSNVIIAGNPARIISSLKDFYLKRKKLWVEDAKKYALAFYHNSGRKPTIEEMSDGFAWLYLPRDNETVLKYRSFFNLSSDDEEEVIKAFLLSKPIYDSFESFLSDCNFEE